MELTKKEIQLEYLEEAIKNVKESTERKLMERLVVWDWLEKERERLGKEINDIITNKKIPTKLVEALK